MKRQMKVEK